MVKKMWTESYSNSIKGLILGDFPGGEKICLSLEDTATREAIARRDPALLDHLFAMMQLADEIAPGKWDLDEHSYPKKPGFIYLLQSTDNAYIYKIGLSNDVARRMKEIGHCRYVHSFPTDDMIAAESRLHTFYMEQRQSGEWFRLHDPNIDFIRSIAQYRDGLFLGENGDQVY